MSTKIASCKPSLTTTMRVMKYLLSTKRNERRPNAAKKIKITVKFEKLMCKQKKRTGCSKNCFYRTPARFVTDCESTYVKNTNVRKLMVSVNIGVNDQWSTVETFTGTFLKILITLYVFFLRFL